MSPDPARNAPSDRPGSALATALVRHRVAVLVAFALLTTALAWPLEQLRVGYSVSSFLRSDEPVLRAAAAHYGEFEVPDNILLFCYPEPAPYSAAAIDRLEDLDRALRRLPGVESVVTLVSAPGLGNGFGERLRRRVEESHVWRHLLVSKRGDALGGIALLNRDDDSPAARRQLFERLRALPAVQGLDLKLAGIPYHRNAIIGMIRADQALFLPLGGAITSLLLLWLIPSLVMALLALLVVPFTLIATLGCMSLAGVELTLLTSALPILLMCMAVAGGVHLGGRFVEERRRGRSPEAAAVRTLDRLLFPCFLTSLTTAIGFLTLTVSTIPDLRQLGWFAALGVGWAYLFTVTALPASLSMVRRQPTRLRVDLAGGLARLAARVSTASPWKVLLPAAVLLAFAGREAMHVEVNNHLGGDYWEDSAFARELRYYEDRFVSMVPSEVLVESRQGFGDGPAREQMSALVDWLEALPEVDRCVSIIDLVRDRYPAFLVRSTGAIGGLLSKDGDTARVLVFQADAGNRYLAWFRDAVARQAAALPDLDARVVGVQLVATTLADRLTGVLSRSFLGSLLIILALVWSHFRSLRLGLVAMLPNVMPLVLNLAFMSWAGMELRPLTVISFCVAFGLAVDDTIHLMARYREERRLGAPPDAALQTTLHTAGRPVVVTTVLLLTGFLVILTSGFRGTHQFGTLVSLALTGSLLGALFLLPALLRVTDRSPAPASVRALPER